LSYFIFLLFSNIAWGIQKMSYLQLITWQTTAKRNKGYNKAVRDTALKHENVGHAAVKLVLPVTEETQKYVSEICGEAGIPYYVVPHEVPKADVNYSGSDMPVATKGKSSAHTQAEFHIYFSFWPGDEEATNEQAKKYTLHTPFEDYSSERYGRNFYGPNRRKDLVSSEQIEIEEIKNKKGKVKRTFLLSPKITHDDAGLKNNRDLINNFRNELQNLRGKLISAMYSQQDGQKVSISDKDFDFCIELDKMFPELNILNKVNLEKLKDTNGFILDKDDFEREATKILEEMTAIGNLLQMTASSLDYKDQVYYRTEGDHGDNTVMLPVSHSSQGSSNDNDYTLDAKMMLLRMKEIVQSKKYGFYRYNCSNAAEDVILSGMQNNDIRNQFLKELGHGALPTTPQIARGKTLTVADEIHKKWKGREAEKDKMAKKESISESITIVQNTLNANLKKNEVIIKKEDIPSQSESKRVTAESLNHLVKMMRNIRREGKYPTLDNALSLEIKQQVEDAKKIISLLEKKRSLSNSNKEKLDNAKKLLKADSRLNSEKEKVYQRVKTGQHTIRKDEMRKRNDKKFIQLLTDYQNDKVSFTAVKEFLQQHPRLKKIKIDSLSLADFARENNLPKLASYLQPESKIHRSKGKEVDASDKSTAIQKRTAPITHKAQESNTSGTISPPIKPSSPLADASIHRRALLPRGRLIPDRSAPFGTIREKFNSPSPEEVPKDDKHSPKNN